ncbi:MAG: Nif3-like dinuclear metal center hexameric protein [Lachnospiraceae bacterium]|nr:Nif3-like dinuclear metal center hexameric protein [Lachnospiraceae bacterium]
MIFRDLFKKLEKLAPEIYALKNDKTGFQIGCYDKDIKKVWLATDLTDTVLEQAVSGGADLILTHHPLIYDPLTQILAHDIVGRRIIKLIRNDINYMAMHTNFDVMAMADYAADILGLSGRQVLDITYENEGNKEGIGRYGNLSCPMTLNDCAEHIKSRFNIDSLKVFGDSNKVINTVAISPGSSGGVLAHAVKAGVDLLITGDIKHNIVLDAMAHGIALIDAGHYETEKIFVPYMKDYFEREIPGLLVFEANEKSLFYVV